MSSFTLSHSHPYFFSETIKVEILLEVLEKFFRGFFSQLYAHKPSLEKIRYQALEKNIHVKLICKVVTGVDQSKYWGTTE